MRLRTAHFACLLMLLSTLGVAETFALPSGGHARVGQYAGSLLTQSAVVGAQGLPHGIAFPANDGEMLSRTLPMPPIAIWTMRPPAAHSAAVHAVTGLAR